MCNLRKMLIGYVAVLFIGLVSCKPSENKDKPESAEENAYTPVTVTNVSNGRLSEYIELNAVSAFLQKSYVKSSANGYLQSVNTYLGKPVEAGQLLFTLKTKESQGIGNAINVLDSGFRFSGMINIKAGSHGFITQLDHQSGDYVQDGEELAVISDMNSFVFLLNLPYELRPAVMKEKIVELILPDGQKLKGLVSSAMPVVDAASQTQNIVLRVSSNHPIPENLIAKVRILKTEKSNTQSIDKAAILSNDIQTEFWVMKMIDSSTAVKTPIKKGIENSEKVEILSPVFQPADKILITGNYGLPDTAKVKIIP